MAKGGWLGLLVALVTSRALAQVEPDPRAPESSSSPTSGASDLPTLTPTSDALQPLLGLPIGRVTVRAEAAPWRSEFPAPSVAAGTRLAPEVVRRLIADMMLTGAYASVEAEALREGDTVTLELVTHSRRILSNLKLQGVDDEMAVLAALDLHLDDELTPESVTSLPERLRRWYAQQGYPKAIVTATLLETDDPLKVALRLDVSKGALQVVTRRVFVVTPEAARPQLEPLLAAHPATAGTPLVERTLEEADHALRNHLIENGWRLATVSHHWKQQPGGPVLTVEVHSGPLVVLRFDGLRAFDAEELRDALSPKEGQTPTLTSLAESLQLHYRRYGYLDASVYAQVIDRPDGTVRTITFKVHEGQRVRVTSREFPCLGGAQPSVNLNQEIDGFLAEQLPDDGALTPVHPLTLDAMVAPGRPPRSYVEPRRVDAYGTFEPETWVKLTEHLQGLLRSEGYLSAQVGPASLRRRPCAPESPPGRCYPVGVLATNSAKCSMDRLGVPVGDPPPAPASCFDNPLTATHCEADATLSLPVRLGPRTELYDVSFEGNRELDEQSLMDASELELGKPANMLELENARRRILDAYAEEGFAFADVAVALDLSPDQQKGRARFTVSERARVRVSEIVIRGAERTSEALIRRRFALAPGKIYRRRYVRATEERLATLGVFSSITVELEDPHIPARDKRVIVTVVERPTQYVEARPGFSTGEGFRVGFEYGHRNIASEAIGFTLRLHLGYLPSPMILERDVRKKFDELSLAERLERNVTARFAFPEVGLGPLFPATLELIDVRDNARDFGLTRDASIGTLIFRPRRNLSTQISASLERNDATIFGNDAKGALRDYVEAHPTYRNIFRVPEGASLAVAERLAVTWDRRDDPLGAKRGTYVSASAEHVHATPLDGAAAGGSDIFSPTNSDFLRLDQRIAGYLPVSHHGSSIALSLGFGLNTQLQAGSRTYPDRLFFLGGVDSLRGFLQDSLVPEDVAAQLLNPSSNLTLRQVVIRGGDLYINPRLELRTPINGSLTMGWFIDSGNLWARPDRFNPLQLRYAVGTGLRIGTPIGPLAFDYGFNVDRLGHELGLGSLRRYRYWEDLGAFHFSVGLF